jgi:iron complex outermembrane recepter protein
LTAGPAHWGDPPWHRESALNSNQKLSSAIAAVLSVPSFSAYAQLTGQGGAASEGIQEVVVTAQRREQSIQDVPITVQALTSESIRQLNVSNLDDFLRFLPGVSQATNGPAQGEVFMRGISVGGISGSQGGGTTGALPSVAIYLDEQSGQLPGRNLDIYAADLERIEVLEGPQGTLFGGGALAGVLRYITNKPKLNITEGSFDAGYGVTAHGDPNSAITAVINLPLITDTLAIRGVFYNDRRGGYIDNLPSTFTRLGTDEGLARYNGGVVPKDSVVINNYNIVQNNINPLTYTGFRVAALWKINDDWDALLTQTWQNMDSQGVFYQMPYGSEGTTFNAVGLPIGKNPLPPLSVNVFNPSYNKDKFTNTALVVNGKFGDWKAIYSGAYLVRTVDQKQDYTNYARGVFGYYYQCAGYSKTSAAVGKCYTPSTIWQENLKNTHQSQELRVSSPDQYRIRGLVGVYWEDYDIVDSTFWHYVTVPICGATSGLNANCFLPIRPVPGSPAFDPVPPIGFFDDGERVYKQLAEFASIDFDIIPHKLTLTGGIRHFKYDMSQTGGAVGSFYCKVFDPAHPPATDAQGFCLNPYSFDFNTRTAASSSTSTGTRGRANLSWKITPDHLVYVTWSTGFRPGQFNRSTSCHLPNPAPNGPDQYCVPAFTVPDTVTNLEFGWKTEWFDHRLLFNGAIYREDWNNAQTSFFDPQGGLGNLVFATNGPSYRVKGIEPSLIARVTGGLTIQAAASWTSTSQTNSPFLVNNNPASPGFGQNITSVPNPYGPLGSPTSYSPPFKVSGRIRYDWVIDQYNAFVQATGNHQAHMVTATGYVAAYDIPAYSTYGASAGISKGEWAAQVYAENLTNSNASVDIGSGQFIEAEVPLRPRVIGLKVSYAFQEK